MSEMEIKGQKLIMPPYVMNGSAKGEDLTIEFSEKGMMSYYFSYEYIVYTENEDGSATENEGNVCEFGFMPASNVEIGVARIKSGKKAEEHVYQFDVITKQQISFYIKGHDKAQEVYQWLQKRINEYRTV
jgi:hypothetical protein